LPQDQSARAKPRMPGNYRGTDEVLEAIQNRLTRLLFESMSQADERELIVSARSLVIALREA